MMPELAENYRLSRIIGVPFPFGHAFGMVHDEEMQLAVATAAVDIVARADSPETRVDVDIEWPVDIKTAYKS